MFIQSKNTSRIILKLFSGKIIDSEYKWSHQTSFFIKEEKQGLGKVIHA